MAFILLAVCCVVKRKWFVATGLFVVSLLLNWWSESYAFHPFTCDIAKSEEGSVRVLTYNVWSESPYLKEHWDDGAKELVDSLIGVDADVMVINELHYGHFHRIVDTLSIYYPYKSKTFVDDSYMATQVFSRYPISNFEYTLYKDDTPTKNDTWLATMTLKMPDEKPVRLIACHLAANQISSLLPDESVSLWKKVRLVYSSMSKAYDKRAVQAEVIRGSLDSCEIPKLVVGDFNDVGGSYTLRHIQDYDMADAWWKGGFGYGATYDMHNLYLRLDHILYSKNYFNLKGVKVLNDWKYSDHYPIVVDFVVG